MSRGELVKSIFITAFGVAVGMTLAAAASKLPASVVGDASSSSKSSSAPMADKSKKSLLLPVLAGVGGLTCLGTAASLYVIRDFICPAWPLKRPSVCMAPRRGGTGTGTGTTVHYDYLALPGMTESTPLNKYTWVSHSLTLSLSLLS